MKVLYAIQGTGNGHLARALELAPYLEKELDIDYLISGRSAELNFPYTFKYSYHGIYFIFGRRGGIDYARTFTTIRPFRFIRDVIACPVRNYDAVINDFEPVSAWAAKLKRVKCVAISHQASFSSSKVPRPKPRSRFFEWAMKYFAPYSHSVGSHYKRYDDTMVLPLIREELKQRPAEEGDYNVVYLPSYGDDILIEHLSAFENEKWKIFSKKADKAYSQKNVEIYPVDRKAYSEALLSARRLIIGAGFQGTSEALYLKKKLLVIPMFDQYEQLCNAAALEQMGVRILERIDDDFGIHLKDFLENDGAVGYSFEPDTEFAAQRIIAMLKP